MLSDQQKDEITATILKEGVLKKEKWDFSWISNIYTTDPYPFYSFHPVNSSAIKFDIYNMIMAVYFQNKKALESYQPKPDYWHHQFCWREARITCSRGIITLNISVNTFDKWFEIFDIDVDVSGLNSYIDDRYKRIANENEEIYYAHILNLKFGGT